MQQDRISVGVRALVEATLTAVWIQWAGLGAFVEAERSPKSLIDLEALLIQSLLLRDRERRLWDVIVSFAESGSSLLSVQRTKNLLARFPESAFDRVAEFAEIAVSEGNDYRWRTFRDSAVPPSSRKRELWSAYPTPWHPAALAARMRLAFGVGINADLLSFLVSRQGEWAEVRQISDAIDYSPRPVRRAADKLSASNFIEGSSERPQVYRLDPARWLPLLGAADPAPKWRYWNLVFPFAADTIGRIESQEFGELSPYLASSRLRDLVEDHKDAFRVIRMPVAQVRAAKGEEFLGAFGQLIDRLSDWIGETA